MYIFAVLWLGWGWLPNPVNQMNLAGPEQADHVLVIFERYGGFAGVHEKFEIHEDGRISNSQGAVRRIPIPQLQSIRRKITALDLPGSSRIELPKGMCSDCFEYRIIFRSPSGKIVLHLNETQMQAQDSISRLARGIQDLILGLKWR